MWAASPRVPNPVLLGPVDRVGGHEATQSTVVGKVDVEVNGLVTASSKTYQSGNYVIRETKTTVSVDGPAKMTPQILESTHGDKEVDVHVDDLDVGSYAFFAGGAGVWERWVRVRGNAVHASRQP